MPAYLVRILFYSFLTLLVLSPHAFAGPQWWQSLYSSNSNSQITLKDENNTSVTAITNPTAASVKLNTTTSTQPPTVIVQATATLPTATIGTACTYGTSTAALSATDRITLLTCGTGNTWQISTRISLKVVNAGDACNITTDGNLAVDSTGLPLSCQSGVWVAQGIGSGQAWQNMLGSAVGCNGVRAVWVLCTNTTGKPIQVAITIRGTVEGTYSLRINGVDVSFITVFDSANINSWGNIFYVIPVGATYMLTTFSGAAWIVYWAELR